MIRVFICLLLIGNSLSAQTANLFDIKIFEDTIGKADYHQIKQKPAGLFQPYIIRKTPIKRSTIYWVKFKLYNADPKTAYFISTPFIFYKEIAFYCPLNDSLIHVRAAINQVLSQKPLYSHSLTIELPKSPDTLQCYMRVIPLFNNYLTFTIIDTKRLLLEEGRDLIPEFFFLGLTFLGFILSLLLYIAFREVTYLYYVLYSASILVSRLVHSGSILIVLNFLYDINSSNDILNLYSITYVSITIFTLLYFNYFLRINEYDRVLHRIVLSIVAVRIMLLIIYLAVADHNLIKITDEILINLNTQWLDLSMQCIVLIMIFKTYDKHRQISLIALFSILIILTGNFLRNSNNGFLFFDSYTTYLNFGSVEVVFFLVSLGYRYYYLKRENENSLNLIIEQMKENEAIKDTINKDLESKVILRTEEIRKLNEELSKHNIALVHKVDNISTARAFQKNMSFAEFSQIFKDEDTCLEYIAQLKWKPSKKYECLKCGSEDFKLFVRSSRRCKSCGYVESPTLGTLYHNVKFSLQKAFYITYLTSTGNTGRTIEESAEEIDLRMATYWRFKQKVQQLMSETKSLKRHQDGWTHLIEFSISRK